jgi:5-oxoprolinase (ATP-hydrolysing)
MLKLADDEPISAASVASVKMGTTVATNALLERQGEPTLLLITRGFRDALRIATQARPRLFDLHIELPELLYRRVVEVDERVSAEGEVVRPLDETALKLALEEARKEGLSAVAIVFMHGYRCPSHEERAATLARAAGFTQVSVSNRVNPLMKLVPRGDTTVVDAYLSPILRRYCDRVAQAMPGVPLFFMQSSGSLTRAEQFQGKDAILSGPAGGIVGMARTAAAAGHPKVIGFDMGGTSTDVSHFAGAYERVFDAEVGGVRVRAPMMSIHTIAAGGGSIVRFDGTRLRVGPGSAGADPGPACYRRGGPLTVTDANVLLKRILPAEFPHVFGRGDEPLDAEAVKSGFMELTDKVSRATGSALSPEQVAAGALKIAVGSMANAVKRISVMRGHDLEGYTLQCFGGAGGQHACQVADALGMNRVYIHPLAGVLSAYGMGLADQGVVRATALETNLDEAAIEAARGQARTLIREAAALLAAQGVSSEALKFQAIVQVRYRGTDSTLPCALSLEGPLKEAAAAIRCSFEEQYRRRFAFLMTERVLVLESVNVEATARGAGLDAYAAGPAAPAYVPEAHAQTSMYCLGEGEQGEWREARVYRREALKSGARIEGPAIITETNATTVVEPGWRADVSAQDGLDLSRFTARAVRFAAGTKVNPVTLELFNNIFMNIAEQMGLRLQNTAHSVNIKERLDFSCALFDALGALIANAPHMPVHLGSMSESIRTVIERNPGMRPGDVFVLNDPYHGGTHLPDITVVTPVYLSDEDRTPSFFVASRGHHADIGGVTPGSMPPFSKRIEDEGVLIDNFMLVSGGVLQEENLRALLMGGPHPARNPEQNIADLRAQVAANEKGVQELQTLVRHYGRETVAAYMRHVQDNAEQAVRNVITALRDGDFELPLDNGALIKVSVRIDAQARNARIDFSGSSGLMPNNFNAPRAITTAAALYVFRTLVNDDIPLNAGCLRPLQIVVPPHSMLNPDHPAAVVAGNVETSQCITNALYGALGVLAAGQCTMNNLTFGNERYQYYETISGGSGAGPEFDGTSVVQTHMTNSRLTDPEVLEFRFPVRLESYEIRIGSGGAGRHHGGDGSERRLRFLEPMTVSILSNCRKVPPFGVRGGQPGALGENSVLRADGTTVTLSHIGQIEVAVGDIMIVKTPGGGGFGSQLD